MTNSPSRNNFPSLSEGTKRALNMMDVALHPTLILEQIVAMSTTSTTNAQILHELKLIGAYGSVCEKRDTSSYRGSIGQE
jgi:hypothetical protein